jgi:riboflavin biosynthesis pyrimidine reductase
VAVSGGAGAAKQYLAGGLIDEPEIHLVPVLLGAGVGLFDDPTLSTVTLARVRSIEAPGVTHIKYQVVR